MNIYRLIIRPSYHDYLKSESLHLGLVPGMEPYYLGVYISDFIKEHDHHKVEAILNRILSRVTTPDNYYLIIVINSGACCDSNYPQIYAEKNGIPCIGLKPDTISYGGNLSLIKRDQELVKMCYSMILIDYTNPTTSLIRMSDRCKAANKTTFYENI
jgi:hypothetical protein